MSPPGRPKGEFRSAQHEGNPVSPPGRPKGEFRSAQHEGTPVSWWRPTAVGLAGLVLLPALAYGALWGASALAGRTPTELLAYGGRLAAESPLMGPVAQPLLDVLSLAFEDEDSKRLKLPFVVPRLAANPGSGASALPALATTPAVAAPGQATQPTAAAGGRLLQVGPGRALRTVAAAAAAARNGDTIEIDPGDYVADVALWQQSDITIRGMGPRVRLIAGGARVEGKATWVVRGGKVTVEGIDFIGSRVSDGNGAGIRFERGQLVVRRCLFFDNQNGILASPNPEGTLEVTESEFSHNGLGDGQTHHLYVGRIKSLTVTGSWFHHANVGHLIKSRAANSLIAYNSLSDGIGGRASYELEFPNGGAARVIGNLIHQSTQTSNSVMVSYGAEMLAWPINRLELAHNTLVNDQPHGGTFVRAVDGAELVLMLDNLLVGRGKLDLPSDAVTQRNLNLGWDGFVQAARDDFRLAGPARAQLQPLPAADIDAALLPRFEYRHPAGLQPLSGPQRYPGALQSSAN